MGGSIQSTIEAPDEVRLRLTFKHVLLLLLLLTSRVQSWFVINMPHTPLFHGQKYTQSGKSGTDFNPISTALE